MTVEPPAAPAPCHRWPDDVCEVCAQVLDEHARIRKILDELERAAASDRLRETVIEFVHVMLGHLELEEEILLPVLVKVDAWGPARVERMQEEHATQRVQLVAMIAEAKDVTYVLTALARDVRQLARDLREDMRHEEADLLKPVLRAEDIRASLVDVAFGG